MRSISGILKIVVFLVVLVGVGVGVGWLAVRPKPGAVEFKPEQPATAPTAAVAPARPPTAPKLSGTAANAVTPVVQWEDNIADILTADTPIPNKCDELFALFPRLPEAGQIEASHHLSNLVSDDDYARLGKIFADPNLSTNVYDVLMLDAMNRRGSVKLPIFLQIARMSYHPVAAEAQSKLVFYLDEDYGTDWNKWEAKIKEWMTNNPD